MTELLKQKILSQIKKAIEAGDFEKIAYFNSFGQRVQELEDTIGGVKLELRQIEKAIDNSDGQSAASKDEGNDSPPFLTGSKSTTIERSGPITVEINFPRLGINRPAVTISEYKASDTLRSVIETLVEAKGNSVLDVLSQIRVNRGPLVTRNPKIDYENSMTGQSYANHQIGSTEYYVLTHSSTIEKVQNLNQIAEALGLSKIFFRVMQNKE